MISQGKHLILCTAPWHPGCSQPRSAQPQALPFVSVRATQTPEITSPRDSNTSALTLPVSQSMTHIYRRGVFKQCIARLLLDTLLPAGAENHLIISHFTSTKNFLSTSAEEFLKNICLLFSSPCHFHKLWRQAIFGLSEGSEGENLETLCSAAARWCRFTLMLSARSRLFIDNTGWELSAETHQTHELHVHSEIWPSLVIVSLSGIINPDQPWPRRISSL